MPETTDIFSINATTPEEAWLHGSASARAWLTGGIRAEDGLDLSAEFDAQASGRLGADVARALASLQGEASATAHAGLRLQVGMPLDLFEGAGLIARVRAEASVSGQIAVTASLSADALASSVLEAIPAVGRPYAEIVLQQAKVSAGVWGRAAFSAMATAELLATVALFPSDGSDPGVTAHLRYGYGWGFGGGWGTLVNVGLDPDVLVERLTGQLSRDLGGEIEKLATAPGTTEVERWLLSIAPRLLPGILRLLVTLARSSVTEKHGPAMDQALAAFVIGLRSAIVAWLSEGVTKAAAEALAALGLPHLDDIARQLAWDAIDAITGARSGRRDETASLISALRIALDIVAALPEPQRRDVAPLIRCVAAFVVLAAPTLPQAVVQGLFPDAAAGASSQVDVAIRVLTQELAGVLAAHALLPDWMRSLIGPAADIVAMVVAGDSTPAEDIALVGRFVHAIIHELFPGDTWATAIATLPPEVRPALIGAVHVLDEFCADLRGDAAARGKVLREGLTGCLVTMIGSPLAHLISTVADTGLRAVPGAFRDLATIVDAGNQIPPSLSWSWNQLGQAAVGVTLGMPAATTLRKTAATIDNWCDTMLPEELRFLRNALLLEGLCERIPAVGTAKALAEFRGTFLLDLAGHTALHVLSSIEFGVREGAELLETLVASAVESIVRSVEVSAIAAFKVLEESIRIAEAGTTELRRRAEELERELARRLAELTAGLRDLSRAITNGLDDIEGRLVDLLLDSALRIGADRGIAIDLLRQLVRAALTVASGGISRGLRDVTTTLTRILDVAAEGLAATAASSNAPRGIRGLFETLVDPGTLPKIRIPVILPIPNPLLPGILPDIEIELFKIEIPAQIAGQLVLTAIFDLTGLGPLLDGLDATILSLTGTRIALDQTKALLEGAQTNAQRDAMERAKSSGPLAVEFLAPGAGSATGPQGEIAFRVRGANESFSRPEAHGLPNSIPRRLVVRVNGRDVTDRVTWNAEAGGVVGRMAFSTTREDQATVFVAAPTCVTVATADGLTANNAAGASRTFIPSGLPRELVVDCIARSPGSRTRITAIGGTTPSGGRWTTPMSEALVLHDRGTTFRMPDGDGHLRKLVVVRSRSGRRYLRAGVGHGRHLSDLPRCG